MIGGQAAESVEVFRDPASLKIRRIVAFVGVAFYAIVMVSIVSSGSHASATVFVLSIVGLVVLLGAFLAFTLRAGREGVAIVGDHVEVRTAFRTRSLARADLAAVTLRPGRSGTAPQLTLDGTFGTVRPRSIVGLNAHGRNARAEQTARFVAMGERLAHAAGVPFKNEYRPGSA